MFAMASGIGRGNAGIYLTAGRASKVPRQG
jgi:hypothetical protein